MNHWETANQNWEWRKSLSSIYITLSAFLLFNLIVSQSSFSQNTLPNAVNKINLDTLPKEVTKKHLDYFKSQFNFLLHQHLEWQNSLTVVDTKWRKCDCPIQEITLPKDNLLNSTGNTTLLDELLVYFKTNPPTNWGYRLNIPLWDQRLFLLLTYHPSWKLGVAFSGPWNEKFNWDFAWNIRTIYDYSIDNTIYRWWPKFQITSQ